MKTFRADLHIHTVLSPCADLEMSPDQILHAAIQKKLDIIAITDHNSTLQVGTVKKLAKNTNLLVIGGCEVNTREEVHALCLFEDDYALRQFQLFLDQNLPNMPNKPSYFGYQVVVNENNDILCEYERYLGNSLTASIETIEQLTHQLGGIFIPAHIDRPINSIFSQLGFIPDNLQVDALQITKRANEKFVREEFDLPPNMPIIKCSDAHYPDDIGTGYSDFLIESASFSELRLAFAGKKERKIICNEPNNISS